ncbi:protein TASOR isoform X1 [Oryzias latipes]|uniref:protein TASOR isoform X1 n=1 Tax=Oryzias latipes TaxID=8090 RepID=UPI0009DA5E86|nr:protein TASOR isoform X1 [Oryzias latipes]
MDDGAVQREACRPRKVSSSELLGANGLQDGEAVNAPFSREAHLLPAGGLSAAARRAEWRNSAPQVVHQRHMPMEPKKFQIPKKTKEQRALFQHVSMESREYEDMKSILTCSYIQPNSAGRFTYSRPRLVHSELLEKEFVEKRKEMKAEGRTEKELEESYCFLLANSEELPLLCEKGLTVGHSGTTLLGNPSKGVYLSKYSDLLQTSPFTSGATGEIIIFKVMKGKVKSIYENMKNLLDPTPRFDAHIAKNASKVTSLTCFRAFDLTQQYFYEYSFDELRPRPRHVCPHAVVFFQVKGKDAPPPSSPLVPSSRLTSRSCDRKEESSEFTVWTGDLVKEDQVLLQISLQSSSPPFLPHRLPEKLQIGNLLRIDHVTRMLPSGVLCYNSYSGSREVVNKGFYCSLLEVTSRNRSTSSVTALLRELEVNNVVLVSPLPDRGFLLLLSSVQMAAPADRRENWKRRLHALFVFQESRDVAKLPSRCDPSTLESSWSLPPVMPHLSAFIPALHHALIKARANWPANLPAGVEHQAQEYFSGLKDGSVPQHPMPEYDSVLDDEGKSLPPPKHHHLSRDSYLHSYLSGPDLYLLPLVRAKRQVEAHLGPEPQEPSSRNSHKAPGREAQDNSDQRVRQLLDLVMTCKRNAENELRREKGERTRAPEKKRKMEQETAERALKYFKASQEPAKPDKTAGNRSPPAPLSLSSVMQSFGLQDIDLKGNGSEPTATLIGQLTGLIQTANQNLHETQGEGPKESNLPTACDVELQEEMEEQTAGSISSSEGFSPGSHSGETYHHGDGGRGGLRRKVEHPEEEEENWPIPWILIPITGLSSERYSQRDRNLPQDPRFQSVTAATGAPTAAAPSNKSPAPSPEHSPPLSPAQCPSPVPSPPTCPSQCPSPQPSSPPSPSQCPSPESSPPSSPLLCPSSDPDAPMPPAPSENSAAPPSPSSSHELKKPPPCDQQLACANEQHPAPPPPWEFPGVLTGGAVEKPPHSPPTLPPHLPAAGSWTSPSAPLEGKEVEELTPPPSIETDVKLDGRQEEGAVLGGSRRAELQGLAEAPPPSASSCTVDITVDKHLGDFSSEMQFLLQEEGVYYNSQQPPPSAVHSEPPTCLRTVPCAPIPSFSHYVTLYHPSPPVQDYMVSLQSSLNDMMAAFEGVCASQRADAGHADASLANTVRDFVASVRAANAPTGSDDAPFVCSEQTDGSVRLHAELLGGGGARRSESADCSPPPGVALPDLSSGSGSVYKSGSGSMETSTERTQNARATVRIANEEEEGVATGPGCTGTGPTPSEHPCKLGTSIAPAPEPEVCPGSAPSSKDLNSVIHQLQPDVLNNLLEIMKDIKKKSPQFYIHCPEAGDRACEEVKDELLRLGNVQQSPVDFLSQENPESGLLVIMRNKDIAAHVHEIPGLVSLKRRPSVVFVGIDSQDDLKSSGWTELFVSGGCIVSDELLLNPDAITCDRLAALLQLLEQHSSPQSLWRWKIHGKTQRKLKEQARFRRDAANLLELLSAYQKRQVVEVLPYHRCDMLNVRSPDLDCLLQLQAQHTQFRHMVFLTERHVDQPLLYSGGGIIVADVEETLQSLSRLAGRHNPKDKCLFLEELLAPKGLCKQNTGLDLVPECSAIPEPPDQLQGINKPPEVPPLPCSSLPPGPEASDQLFPDAASKDRLPLATSRDMEFLQQAIKQLRAERQEQLQRLRLQRELLQSQAEPTPPKPPGPINGHNPPLLTPPIPSRKAAQSPPSDPLLWDRGGGAPATEGQQEGGAEGNCTANTEDPFDPPARQNTTAVVPRGQREAGGEEREEESAEGGGATSSPAEGDISQEAASVPEVAVSRSTSAVATQSSSRSSVVVMETDEKKNCHAAQQLITSQPPSYCQLRQRSVGLLQTPHLPSIYAQFLPPRPTRGFMRPTHLWQGTGPPLVWGFQQTRMEFLGGYYSPAGGNMHRGGRRGGGFNGL